jgi:putative nucleotidyltransferase with HDIG domain
LSWNDIPDSALKKTQEIMEQVLKKDPETYWHCVRVGRAAKLLAEAVGLNEYETRVIETSGLFHDVGKVGIPSEILLKPAKLTDAEYKVMMSHPELSVEMLKPLFKIQFFKDLEAGVLHHHERIDGKGYPFQLEGDKIPLAARIILVVDTFDAMTADRAYRKGLSPEVALKELQTFAGRQFDEHLVKIFLQAKPFWARRERELAANDPQPETLRKLFA